MKYRVAIPKRNLGDTDMDDLQKLKEITRLLQQGREELAADNRAAGYANIANVLLVQDNEITLDETVREFVADYFIDLKYSTAAEAAKRICQKIAAGTNRRGITRVAVIPRGQEVSCIAEIEYPDEEPAFSTEFTPREGAWMFQ